MLNKKKVAQFEKDLMKALNQLVGNSNKLIKMRDKSAKCHEFKGCPKDFVKYIEEKYG